MRRCLFVLAACAFPAYAALADFEARKMFQAMDQDRDRRVSAAEMSAAQKALSGLQKQRLSAAEHESASKAMFARMDADQDGFLTKEEWSAGHGALAGN